MDKIWVYINMHNRSLLQCDIHELFLEFKISLFNTVWYLGRPLLSLLGSSWHIIEQSQSIHDRDNLLLDTHAEHVCPDTIGSNISTILSREPINCECSCGLKEDQFEVHFTNTCEEEHLLAANFLLA